MNQDEIALENAAWEKLEKGIFAYPVNQLAIALSTA